MSNVFILLGAGSGNDIAAFKKKYEGEMGYLRMGSKPHADQPYRKTVP